MVKQWLIFDESGWFQDVIFEALTI